MLYKAIQSPEIFVGRERELDVLKDFLFHRRWHRDPLFISGPAGIGKTALVSYFLSQNLSPDEYIWVTDGRNFVLDRLRFDLPDRLDRRGVSDVTVIVDGEDSFSRSDREHLISEIRNFKRVDRIIVTTRDKPERKRGEILSLGALNTREALELLERIGGNSSVLLEQKQLANGVAAGNPFVLQLIAKTFNVLGASALTNLLRGQIYDLSTSPEDGKIITLAKPEIILANDNLIERLRKEPQSIYELTPRKFEEVLADLLTDMGMEVELTQQTRDGGRDLLAYHSSPLGKLLCLIEAKKYRADRTVGIGLVKQLFGTLCDEHANSAMMITTSSFSKDAKDFQSKYEYKLQLREFGDIVTWIQGYRTGNRTL